MVIQTHWNTVDNLLNTFIASFYYWRCLFNDQFVFNQKLKLFTQRINLDVELIGKDPNNIFTVSCFPINSDLFDYIPNTLTSQRISLTECFYWVIPCFHFVFISFISIETEAQAVLRNGNETQGQSHLFVSKSFHIGKTYVAKFHKLTQTATRPGARVEAVQKKFYPGKKKS